jgi:hypothetical protein
MPYKKSNEAWFGDSFNRGPMTLTFLGENDNVYSCAVNNVSIENSLEGSCTFTADLAPGSDWTVAKGVNSCSYASGATSHAKGHRVSTLETEIKKVQAQIDGLKQKLEPKNGANKLRLMLKTLNYTREL